MDSTLKTKLEKIKNSAFKEISEAGDDNAVYVLKSRYVGKKSEISDILKGLGSLSIEERREVGGQTNKVKNEITDLITRRLEEISGTAVSADFDPGLPGLLPAMGNRHPLTIVFDEIKQIFLRMGFTVAEGPDVETDYYNFEALNYPKDHPARDMHDTFYVDQDIILRTQTSPVQIRVMEKQKPPVRIIAPGRVYRKDELDATHSPVFHQVEGLYVDEDVTFGDLKGTLDGFVRQVFGSDVKSNFRPSYFPFTEPSAEVDIQCFLCKGRGCTACKRSGWLEIMGCGMVDPNVFHAVNIDPEKYTGFAFGMGVERIAMLKYGIEDIRLFLENDIRFLEQFK